MSKWLESLGFGAQKPKRTSSPAIARIRETMRWRGFDLSAYSDEEIDAARYALGDGVSETGETTHASREALAAMLLERRQKGLSPETVNRPAPASPAPARPSEQELAAAESSPSADEPTTTEEPTVPAEPTQTPRWEEPESRGTGDVQVPSEDAGEQPEAERPERDSGSPGDAPGPYKPAPGRYKSPLLLGMHSLGLHSWKYRDDEPGGPRLRCDGCGKERPAGTNARPTVVAPAPPDGPGRREGDETNRNDEPITLRPQDARDAWSNDRSIDDPGLRTAPPPRPAAPRPGQGASDNPSLFQKFLRSPWWVKTVAIFFLLQVVGMLASLFSGGAS